ncbi:MULTISPECIES: phosphorylcholine phosphatase [Burkholderia]|uniref:Phosphorylcholine phosphatase n=1 Tax=Burkholderia gladioli TaxID=28095 RepID=A0A2A7SIP0_BURGA|nr:MULTISPECIES: phosphorylcholine phosphatase [Burkholderia]ATF88725.1 phosphorylcholine phosphatase [Burkholderia gladioli pv. gladioli]MBJ9712881.1 haloacid dehalogenase-like hydrolase [Burkholderia gladioli]MBU9156685.1 haloacid dehalogenase-like hydrolase [Burkholderia gladioli]MBU9193863.1 haloacid dehalogenase-like hydrolase [Burkholderia gladioli]MBU9273616.1 haloacid dehalogenase-like hydrolase [Burkholderia gladioli]
MPKSVRRLAAASLALFAFAASAGATDLAHWPPEAARKLDAMIAAHANRGDYAVFDADNTTYRYDLEESLLPYLEQNGRLTRETLDPSLKLIPFKDTPDYRESLTSYYYRLCEIDDLVCYPWIAQAFSGLSLAELKTQIDAMLATRKPIPIRYWSGDKVEEGTVEPPRFFTGMQELYNKLRENGIAVYVMTAAHEELTRMVVADPKYGYNVKPQNVIGVTTLLRDPQTQALTTSRIQIRKGDYDEMRNRSLVITPYLMNPMTWYEGKLGSIVGYIDQWKKPVLVAGDTPKSDGYMLLNATDVEHGGVRVWVDKKDKNLQEMRRWRAESAARQKALGQRVTADRNWIEVKPDAIQ